MEFLTKLFVQTQNHLKGLTASQKLAIGSCVGLIVVALLWMVNWAGSPVMVPLLDQSISGEDLATIESRLGTMSVEYKISGDRILVPADAQYRIRARLAEAQVLPRDTSIGFSKLIEQNSSPWLNMAEQDRRWALALSNELSRVLREMEGVTDARVFLDKTTKRTIGQPPVIPTASVFVRPEAGSKLSQGRLMAIANMVSAAVSGLEPTRVKVADMASGRAFTMPSEDEALAFDDLDDRKKKEEHFASKIKNLLAHIPGLLVAVHADLEEEATEVLEEKHGKPVLLTDKAETETSTRGRSSEEPGVNPNTSVAIAGGGNSENMERNKTEATFDGRVDRTVTKTQRPRHGIRRLFASVNVPRSYLAAIFEKTHDKEPSDVDLETFSTPELDKVKAQVLRVLALTGETDEEKQRVQVDWFHDEATAQALGTMQAGPSDGVMALVRTYGSKAGLGGLAAVSLLMMLMMVRRVSEGPVLPGEEPPAPRVIHIKSGRKNRGGQDVEMAVGEEAIGEASASDTLMMGKEVDERTIQMRKVVDQVVEMVKEDPDASVSVLKRWIDSDQG